jgi:GPI mannosyltransferase 3
MINKFTVDTELIIILLISISVKTAIIILLPALYHADENFQLFEAAHRLSFGYGIAPWEFREGIRSLVVPSALAGIFTAVSAISDRPEVYISVARFFLACFSLLGVTFLYNYAKAVSKTHAVVASTVLAVWYEAVFFSIRPLTECLAANALVCAVCLGLSAVRSERRLHLLLSGFFASLTVMFRFHIGPGALVLAIWVCRLDIRHKWLPFIVGALPPLIFFGVADWITWGAPFSSFINYFKINILDGKAKHYGIEPIYWYIVQIYENWFVCIPVFILLIAYKIKEKVPWILAAAAIVISHSAIAHKEYRFIYPALTCFLVAAALGSGDVVQRLARHYPKVRVTAAVIVLWCTASVALAISPPFLRNWKRSRELVQAYYFLHSRTDMCGLFLYDTGWWDSGGYAHLHRNVPIYDNEETEFESQEGIPLANYVIAPGNELDEFEKYKKVKCFEKKKGASICILRRRGTCAVSHKIIPLALKDGLGEE